MGRDVPNEPYKADYRYPGWPHNEKLIAIDLVLAIAGSDHQHTEGLAIAGAVTVTKAAIAQTLPTKLLARPLAAAPGPWSRTTSTAASCPSEPLSGATGATIAQTLPIKAISASSSVQSCLDLFVPNCTRPHPEIAVGGIL